jgi:hypothetical protein
MSAIQQLDDALQERNKKTNEFIETIIAAINQSVKNLPLCTSSNSTPEVAGSVRVLKSELDEIIRKIKNYGNIDESAAQRLVDRLQLSNLKKSQLTNESENRSSTSSNQSANRSSEFSGSSPRSS